MSKSEFREALSRFPTGVTILTLNMNDGTLAGLTVSSFSSVSLDPQMVLACVDSRSRCVPSLNKGQPFAISILSEEQADIAQHFATPLVDKFATVSHSRAMNGAPLIDGACAQIECTVNNCHDGGDHIIVVGAVERIVLSHDRPLIYAMRNFHRLCTGDASISAGAEKVQKNA